MFMKASAFAVICSAFAFGCSAEQTPAEERQEIIDNLIQSGIPENDIMVVDGLVYAGRDGHVTLQASREMIEIVAAGEEQYRTTNLVGTGVSKICILPTSQFASYSR